MEKTFPRSHEQAQVVVRLVALESVVLELYDMDGNVSRSGRVNCGGNEACSIISHSPRTAGHEKDFPPIPQR